MDITRALRVHKQQVYRSLKNLESKGLVSATLDHPSRYSAEPFQKAIDLFIKAKMEEAKSLRHSKDSILKDWRAIAIENGDTPEKFTVLKGRNVIYHRINQMMQQTEKKLSIMTSVTNWVRADQLGLIDKSFKKPKEEIELRFLTELPEQTAKTMSKLVSKTLGNLPSVTIRVPDLGLTLFNRLVIRDDEEAIFFINKDAGLATEKDDLSLWTNCKPLVCAFTRVFENLWSDATGIHLKIAEIETGMLSPKTFVIRDAETARKRYTEALKSAKESIFKLTSSAGLAECWKSGDLVQEWIDRGVSVRIMAPVTTESLEAAVQLMKICEVRHVPMGYVETTIVDGKHLFQFKSPALERPEPVPYFENTFYTNDSDHVKKTKNMLSHIWESSQPPVAVAFKSLIQQSASTLSPLARLCDEYSRIIGFEWRMEPQLGRVTEKDIAERIRSARRVSVKDARDSTLRVYSTMGCAVVYPPDSVGLPNFIIQASHNFESSAFGPENFLVFYLQMKVAEQQSYLPVAFVTDNHRGCRYRKTMHIDQVTTEVVHLVKKGELEVQLRGKSLFAGWTVPIPLLPPKHILPPACVFFEGYGDAKTYYSEVKGIFDRREVNEYNCLDAFVTFMNPSSRYSGPASDGLLLREVIFTSYPPSA